MKFDEVIKIHAEKYPLMEPQDWGKLAYQSACGPGHLTPDLERVTAALSEEWCELPADTPAQDLEEIGGGLCRFHLDGRTDLTDAVPILAELLCRTAERHENIHGALQERLSSLKQLPIEGMSEWLAKYCAQNFPPLHHSQTYRNAYHPHYRVIQTEYARWFPALLAIRKLLRKKNPALIAIDGRCGSGKSTFAAFLSEFFPCRILHMDDFYCPIPQRSPNWEEIPGGNMDLERFRKEAALPALAGEVIHYRPYDCQSGSMRSMLEFAPMPLTVIEGSYSHHPDIQVPYDLKIFLTVSPDVQISRLREREGGYVSVFESRWIPLEERYFRAFCVPENSDLVLST